MDRKTKPINVEKYQHANPNTKENTEPYPDFDTGAMRKQAEHQAHTDGAAHAKHDRELASLDHAEEPIKGGR